MKGNRIPFLSRLIFSSTKLVNVKKLLLLLLLLLLLVLLLLAQWCWHEKNRNRWSFNWPCISKRGCQSSSDKSGCWAPYIIRMCILLVLCKILRLILWPKQLHKFSFTQTLQCNQHSKQANHHNYDRNFVKTIRERIKTLGRCKPREKYVWSPKCHNESLRLKICRCRNYQWCILDSIRIWLYLHWWQR